jgi:hypothetical protein
MSDDLRAPFPWFGGKSRVADLVWSRFGDVPNYVEPFFGSGAVLLGRYKHHAPHTETVNDLDGFVANFWRAIKLLPDETAEHADNPVNENDLHARHVWLVGRREVLRERLEADPGYCDPKIAGWWAWGLCCWIGSGWCSGAGPWSVVDGKLVKGDAGQRVNRKRPHLGDAGKGVNRQLPHLGDAGKGVNRQLPHLSGAGQGEHLREYFRALADRLRGVRVASGDWSRICGPSPTTKLGLTGVFLDPPYADTAGRGSDLYREDSLSVAHDVREWAIANGDNPMMRIALCGYEGEHTMPAPWACVPWKAHGGYGGQGDDNVNATRERIWFSPHCLSDRQGLLF